MIHNLPVTLAVDLFELIIYGIFGIIALGSMIANWFKQNAEKQKREQRMARGQGGDSGGAVSLDDLAARRREELRRAAQQRSMGGGTAASGGGAEPGNLTMAQRIERARAQEAYRKRTEALRQQQAAAGAPQQRQPVPHEEPAEVLAERRRREMEAAARQQRETAERARQQREVQAALERRRREAAVRQRQEHARAAQQQGRPSRAPSRPAPLIVVEPEPEVRTLHVLDEVHDADKRRRSGAVAKPMRRMAASKAARGDGIRGRQLGILLTNAQSFRQALILKEVLDKPLSMRQPEADRFYA